MSGPRPLPSIDVLQRIVDVHCHPTDTSPITSESMEKLAITICAMSSRKSDQGLVSNLASSYPEKVIPCFGYHPWFSHLISLEPGIRKQDHFRSLFKASGPEDDEMLNTLIMSLPEPTPLHDVLSEIRRNLEAFPNAMLGEVGLDRSFRIPFNYLASPRVFTPFTVPIEHQLAILQPQLDLAVELGRNVSLHSVKAHQATLDVLANLQRKHGAKWKRVCLDMHSCGFSPQMWSDIQKKYRNVYLSLSTVINARSPNHLSLIKVCDPNRILVESDYNDVEMCAERTWDMVLAIAEVKGWKVESKWTEEEDESEWGVVRKLQQNWQRFKAGQDENSESSRKGHKNHQQTDWDSDSEYEVV